MENLQNLPIIDMSDSSQIRSWYIAYLAYNDKWQDLLSLLADKNFNSTEISTIISDRLQQDFLLMYKKDYISDLITHLPLPGTKDAENLSLLLWLDDEQYAKDYLKLSEYYKNKTKRISRYIYHTSGLSGNTPQI